MSSFLLSHPTINANWRNLALAIAEGDALAEFHTTLAWSRQLLVGLPLNDRIRLEMSRREVDPRVGSKLVLHPVREIGRILINRLQQTALKRPRSAVSIENIYRSLDRTVAKRLDQSNRLSGVISGEDGCFEIFRVASRHGIKKFYELPIGYYQSARKIILDEEELCPEFASLLPGVDDSAEKLERKKMEAEMADKILVPSEFVRTSLLDSGVDAKKLYLNSYGTDTSLAAREWPSKRSGPLRLLFVGGIHQRKGIGYLLRAVKKLGRRDVTLTLLGTLPENRDPINAYREHFNYLKPMPQEMVKREIRRHDVLVLPSLLEGFALVILEAMAAGIPVIVTENTGARPVVRDGIDGFMIPIRSVDSLMENIIWAADHHQDLAEMGANARRRAEEFSWERYRDGIRKVIKENLADGSIEGGNL